MFMQPPASSNGNGQRAQHTHILWIVAWRKIILVSSMILLQANSGLRGYHGEKLVSAGRPHSMHYRKA